MKEILRKAGRAPPEDTSMLRVELAGPHQCQETPEYVAL